MSVVESCPDRLRPQREPNGAVLPVTKSKTHNPKTSHPGRMDASFMKHVQNRRVNTPLVQVRSGIPAGIPGSTFRAWAVSHGAVFPSLLRGREQASESLEQLQYSVRVQGSAW